MSPQNLNRWWKRRRAQDRPTVLKKFCECCWKGFYYMTSFSYGLWVLWDKPYFWNFKLSVESYPYHVRLLRNIFKLNCDYSNLLYRPCQRASGIIT